MMDRRTAAGSVSLGSAAPVPSRRKAAAARILEVASKRGVEASVTPLPKGAATPPWVTGLPDADAFQASTRALPCCTCSLSRLACH